MKVEDQETLDKLMRARDDAVSQLASIWNYIHGYSADDTNDDVATDDDYEAAIDRVVSAHLSIHNFLDQIEKRKRRASR